VARKDYYAILGVSRKAGPEEIRKAFRARALALHPDRNPGDAEAERRFREVAEAWEVLGDPEQRARYDRLGPLFTPSGRPPTPEDLQAILRDAVGSLFGRPAGAAPADVRHALSVPLELAATGGERSVAYLREVRCGDCGGRGDVAATRATCDACGGTGKDPGRRFLRTTCGACHGTGQRGGGSCGGCGGEGLRPREETLRVRIPAGVASGQKLRVRGRGNESRVQGVPPSDLYVLVDVLEHPLYVRRGPDLLCEVPLSWPQAVLGTDVVLPLPDGTTVTLHVPPATPAGRAFRVDGAGLPGRGRGRGDLHVRVSIDVPEALTDAQRGLVAQVAHAVGIAAHPRINEWLARRDAVTHGASAPHPPPAETRA
jgi:molecular chaperone DnaJ